MSKNAQKIGWIGAGRMGSPMAERLLKAGYDVSIWNRTRAKAEPLAAKGGKVVDTIVNTVLYEGYMLYPYRRSALKNKHRWNFGLVYPDGLEPCRDDALTVGLASLRRGAPEERRELFLEKIRRAADRMNRLINDAKTFASHGAVVIAIDAPFARRTGSTLRMTKQDRDEQIQLMKDLQRAVDVLRAQPNVDKDRIAYVGVSYGGAMGVQFAAIEHRIKAAVLVVADGGNVMHETKAGNLAFMASLSCATRVAWFRNMIPIEPIRFVGFAKPTPLLLQNGKLDEAVAQADAQLLHNAAPEPKTVFWYNAGHNLNQQALLDAHDWLVEKIGLDPRQ